MIETSLSLVVAIWAPLLSDIQKTFFWISARICAGSGIRKQPAGTQKNGDSSLLRNIEMAEEIRKHARFFLGHFGVFFSTFLRHIWIILGGISQVEILGKEKR